MSNHRMKQACAACTRRKVKCSKTMPCTNCIRRGEVEWCTLNTHASPSLPPTSSLMPLSSPKDELQVLRKRVAELEAKLLESSRSPRIIQTPQMSPTFQAPQTPASPVTDKQYQEQQHDTVVEDAASILEFLAWGRRKDPALHPVASAEATTETTTDAVRDRHGADADTDTDTDTDTDANTDTDTDTSAEANSFDEMGMAQIAVLQMLLPDRRMIGRLVDYHLENLLWFHISLHAPTFRRQLAYFLGRYGGSIEAPGVSLLWVALLFAVLVGSITCAPEHIVAHAWGFGAHERAVLSRRWFRAVIACLNKAEYTANLSILSVQAISTLTISAHLLGFSNMQSIHLAAAVRIAQSLGLHRIPAERTGTSSVEHETGRRLWLQLCCQDWFGIPFSESCLIHPLYAQSEPPINCHDEGPDALQTLPEDVPTVTSYCRFLTAIASIMPQLQDGLLSRNAAYTRYERVLAADKRMRALATAERPPFFMNNTPLDHCWPVWVLWARRALAVSSAHKIIMIHRAFLSESFTNPAYAFTRWTCLAAAKTIIREYKNATDEDIDGPVLWSHQAFSVTASIILILDVLHRHPSESEYTIHLKLAEDAVRVLGGCVATSLIAMRGVNLLSALILELRRNQQVPITIGQKRKAGGENSHETEQDIQRSPPIKKSRRGLDVPLFVQSFCGGLATDMDSTHVSERDCHIHDRPGRMSNNSYKGRRNQGSTAADTAADTITPSAACYTSLEGIDAESDAHTAVEQEKALSPSDMDAFYTFGNLLYPVTYGFSVP